MSVPNQKIITIHKTKEIPFVMVGIEELRTASKALTPSALDLYLYLAGNEDGYRLELSRVAFENAMGYSKATYHRAYKELVAFGYIYKDNCGRLNFATSPHESYEIKVQNWDEKEANLEHPIVKNEMVRSQKCNSSYSEMNTEIKNKDNRENRENRELKKASPSSSPSLDYLKGIIKPNGNYKTEDDGWDEWLEDEVPNLWHLVRAKDTRVVREIYMHTNFEIEEAKYIANNILDWNSRMWTFREGDF